jgi:hypothetical protein
LASKKGLSCKPLEQEKTEWYHDKSPNTKIDRSFTGRNAIGRQGKEKVECSSAMASTSQAMYTVDEEEDR